MGKEELMKSFNVSDRREGVTARILKVGFRKTCSLPLFILTALAAVFFAAHEAYGNKGPQVEIFSPEGTVKNVRQVTVRFSEPMTPFGDPRGAVMPFDVISPVPGVGRWADSRNWVYDFERNLPGGIRCEFRLKEKLRSLSGAKLRGRKIFSFSTGGPSIVNAYPYDGSQGIDEEQVFILALDAEPATETLPGHVAFLIEGIEGPVGISLIEGEEREKIIKAFHRSGRPIDASLVLIRCVQRFPAETPVRLIWGKGVLSKTNVPTEQDQILKYRTRARFTARFECSRENPEADCSPLLAMSLRFSSPVSREQAEAVILRSSEGRIWKPAGIEEDNSSGVSFSAPFPEKTVFSIELPPELKDEAGRPLVNAGIFPLEVKTDRYPPLAKFSARFGIIELNGDRILPVTLRNLEPEIKTRSVKLSSDELRPLIRARVSAAGQVPTGLPAVLKKVASATREQSMLTGDKTVREFTFPKPSGAKAFEVAGIKLDGPGLYLVEIESAILGRSLLGKAKPAYVPAAALVTNLSVHFKWGRESSLVWVTELDSGETVKDAAVTVTDCNEKTLWHSNTDENGVAVINEPLPSISDLPRCSFNSDARDHLQLGAIAGIQEGVFAVAKKKGDMAFVHSNWDSGIEPFRFHLSEGSFSGGALAHTVFDRTLLRAGETVHMKHILRRHTTRGIVFPDSRSMPDTLRITHVGSFQSFEIPIKWESVSSAVTNWPIPREARLGAYEVSLVKKKMLSQAGQPQEEELELRSGSFRVEEFRVPLMKASLQGLVGELVNPSIVPLDVAVQYLAGGGADGLAVKIRSALTDRFVPGIEGFEGFVFSNGAVKEGTQEEDEWYEDGERAEESPRLPALEAALDQTGGLRLSVPNIPIFDRPKKFLAEMEYRDPNGEIQTVSTSIPIWNAAIIAGIRPDSWASSNKELRFQIVALDLKGKAMAGVPVKVILYEKKYLSHRKRVVGGFYSYENRQEIKRIGVLCEGRTDSTGLLLCDAISPVSGNIILEVDAVDPHGNHSYAHEEVWIADRERWWFDIADHDRMDLIPEKRRYEPGEKAVFQVRMPFKEANALITVEREGVVDYWVMKISGERPLIEVPVKGIYAPNVFVSALVVRGRMGEPQPTAMADMGRPAYKLGIAEIMVGWKEHELKVTVKPDQEILKVREKAKVSIAVKKAHDGTPPASSEAVVAVVDEGLLELSPNRSWDILDAMMGKRGYEVQTSTAQMQVVGRRHYGLKALPAGGGGGRRITRELFDTLVFWKVRVELDQKGEGYVEVPLNDSVTAFRIAAVVTGEEGLFGEGSALIRSTRDIMIFPGIPPLVREGDRFPAEFTIRNTTEKVVEASASVKAEGIEENFPSREIILDPGQAKTVGWETRVPEGISNITWELDISDKGGVSADRIKVSQKVVPAVPVRPYQAAILQIEGNGELQVRRPEGALPGRGGLRVNLMRNIAGGLDSAREYMSSYPYGCMEQKISRAISLRDEELWRQRMAELPAHQDRDGLIKYFPSMDSGSPVLTSYIAAIAHEAGWVIPEDVREKMLSALAGFVEGRVKRNSPIPAVDLSLRKLASMDALSRFGRMKPGYLGLITIEPNLWPTSALIDWINILVREEKIPAREENLKKAEKILRSRLAFHGTAMSFSTERNDALWWLMVSGDVNALRSILAVLPLRSWREDVVRMVRGALARQKRGRWDLTLANAWGVLALEKFERAFEGETVSGRTSLRSFGDVKTHVWDEESKGENFDFGWSDRPNKILIRHEGTGKPWALLQSLAAIPLKEALSSGYRIKKTIIPVEKKRPDSLSSGDILKIRLDLEAQSDQTWVAVSDPIPAGASILGRGLARDSALLTKDEKRSGHAWPAYEERTFEGFRAYYEYVPKGSWSLEYTVRINQSGSFQLPPTRVEALYLPEMMGELPNDVFEVAP